MIQKGDIYGELTQSATEGMKGAELPVSDGFIKAMEGMKGQIKSQRRK